MGLWDDFKKEVLDGEDFQTLKKDFGQIAADVGKKQGPIKRVRSFQDKCTKMVVKETAKDIKNQKKAVKELQNMEKVAIGAIAEKFGEQPLFPGRREKLILSMGGKTAAEAVYNVAHYWNKSYNRKQSPDAVWLNIGVGFFAYQVLKEREIAGLKVIEKEATTIGAKGVMQEAQKLQQEYEAEEGALDLLTQETDPDNYGRQFFWSKETRKRFMDNCRNAELEMENRLLLFERGGRSDLLRRFNRYLGDLAGDAEKVTKAVDLLEAQLRQNGTLAEKVQTAQSLRQELGLDDQAAGERNREIQIEQPLQAGR